MKVTYEIHQYDPLKTNCMGDTKRIIEVSSNNKQGKRTINAFESANKLYVDAIYAGCRITAIED